MKRVRTGWGILIALVVLAVIVVGILNEWLQVPDRWNPMAPLWPQEAPTFLTSYKLARLAGDAPACLKALDATAMTFVTVPDRPTASGCGWSNAVRVTAVPGRVSPFLLSCPAALSLAMWERHTLQPAAQELLGSPVVALEHFGSYACRNIGGVPNGGDGDIRRSEHATANALDVAVFVLADGRAIDVARDWQRPPDDQRRLFLKTIHDGACSYWNVVLGPEYNAAHRDHFHFDQGQGRACR